MTIKFNQDTFAIRRNYFSTQPVQFITIPRLFAEIVKFMFRICLELEFIIYKDKATIEVLP